jgi:hypothetical protein
MFWGVPFLTPRNDDDSWKTLKVGDRCQVKFEVPASPGRIGQILEIADGDYVVQFENGRTMGYDGDMLQPVKV